MPSQNVTLVVKSDNKYRAPVAGDVIPDADKTALRSLGLPILTSDQAAAAAAAGVAGLPAAVLSEAEVSSLRSVANCAVATSQPSTGPIIVAHRGGPLVWPENSLSAFKASYSSGIKYIEMDVWRMIDGTLGVMHDEDVSRTTDGTGLVTSKTIAQFRALKIDALAANSNAYELESPPLLSEVLDWAIDKDVVLVVEAKHSAAIVPMLMELESRNFPKSKFIFQSFTPADFDKPIANGWRCLALSSDATNSFATYVKSIGVTDIAGTMTLFTEDKRQFAKSIGLSTWVYTAKKRSEVAASAAHDYIFCDDPVYCTGSRTPMKFDTFQSGKFYPGHYGAESDGTMNRGVFQQDGTLRIGTSATSKFISAAMGGMCPIGGPNGVPSSYTIEAEFEFVATSSADRWIGVMLNAATDEQYYDTTPGKACHHVLARLNGYLDIFSKLDGQASALGQRYTGTALSLSTKYKITISVTPTGLMATLNNGATVTFNDSRFRGGYIQIGSSGADVKWYSLKIS